MVNDTQHVTLNAWLTMYNYVITIHGNDTYHVTSNTWLTMYNHAT